MPGACLNSWQTDACEWSIAYVWRSSDWIERGLFIALALMLFCTLFVVGRFSRCYYVARREARAFVPDSWRALQRRQRTFVGDLSRGLRTLKAIATAAPFLGLAGTSYWILGGLFFGYSGSKARFFSLIEARTASSLLTAATAILVAILAILSHNFLYTRVVLFEREFSRTPDAMAPHEDGATPRAFRRAQTLPLKKRFSAPPPFALIAAPALASVIAIFMPYEPYRVPTGLGVRLVSNQCELEGDRPIVLRISDTGELHINQVEADWKTLAYQFSQIYRARQHHTLYVLADDGVPFQTVADAVDIAENSPVAGSSSADVAVWLITPKAMHTGCQSSPESISGLRQSDSSEFAVALADCLR